MGKFYVNMFYSFWFIYCPVNIQSVFTSCIYFNCFDSVQLHYYLKNNNKSTVIKESGRESIPAEKAFDFC